MNRRRNIVILGAGYGGLCAAHSLQKLVPEYKANIVLVNRNSYHINAINLHEVAMGNALSQDIIFDIVPILHKPHARFSKGEVLEIDTEKRIVKTDREEIPYEYLVIALGFEPESFGIPGIMEYAHQIYNIEGCEDIAIHLEDRFRNYSFSDPMNRDHNDLRILIGGSGFTGVELLGDLIERVKKLCKKYKIDRDRVTIECISADKSFLPMMSPEAAKYVRNYLEREGVIFSLESMIKEVTPNSFIYTNPEGEQQECQANTIVWAGGVKGSPLMEETFGDEVRRGRIIVEQDLSLSDHPEVFVVGDCSAFIAKGEERPLPTTAQAATQMGHHVAKNISRDLKGRPRHDFEFSNKGTICSLGRFEGVAELGDKIPMIKGLPAMELKRFVESYTDYRISGLRNAIKYNRIFK